MIIKTEGIVINYIKYKESSIIIKILTQEYGFQSFILNGVRSVRSKKSIGFFQSLNVLELVAYKSPKADLYRLNEFKIVNTWFKQPDAKLVMYREISQQNATDPTVDPTKFIILDNIMT